MEKNEQIFKNPYEAKPVQEVSQMRGIKKRMLNAYRQENAGIMERLEKSPAGYNTDQLLNLIIEEMLNSTEELQGTSLVLESEGNLKDASTVTISRANLLKLIAEIVSRKKELHQRAGEIDLNSPAFFLFQKLCFEKMVEVFENLRIDNEMVSSVLTLWQDKMQHWDRDLRDMLKDLDT